MFDPAATSLDPYPLLAELADDDGIRVPARTSCPVPADATCVTCRWYSGNPWYECRRRAPVASAFQTAQNRPKAVWPSLGYEGTAICGEWTAKPEGTPDER